MEEKIHFIKRILPLFLLFLFLASPRVGMGSEEKKEVSLVLFWAKGCPHCEQEQVFLIKLQKRYPFLKIKAFEVWESPDNQRLLEHWSKELQIPSSSLPITIIEREYFIGFLNEETTGKAIEQAILRSHDRTTSSNVTEKRPLPETIHIPFLGALTLKNLSLPVLTILLGAIDGFNPCAMWVLLMLLSFLISIHDRKKLLILGGLFLFASGVVYLVFMVAWLNIMLFYSYIPWIKIAIGSLAILGGGYNLKEFWTNKEGHCKVTGAREKRLISEKLAAYITRGKFFLAALAIILLAFLVNLVELICSIGLPAVYTQVLALTPLSTMEYSFYLLLYLFFFLLDDLLVFFLAVYSLRLFGFSDRYSHYSRCIGGALLIAIGILLLFKPEWLMFG